MGRQTRTRTAMVAGAIESDGFRLCLCEGQQVGIHNIRVGGAHAMR